MSAFDRASGRAAWSATVALGAPVLHLVMLDSDAHGYVYLAADVGEESPAPPYAIGAERIVIVRLDAGGREQGTTVVPPWRGADETFRPMSVDADGAIYVMAAGDDGLGVVRYTF